MIKKNSEVLLSKLKEIELGGNNDFEYTWKELEQKRMQIITGYNEEIWGHLDIETQKKVRNIMEDPEDNPLKEAWD